MSNNYTAIISIIGADQIGLVAKISSILAKKDINILESHQQVLENTFVMYMLVDVSKSSLSLSDLSIQIDKLATKLSLQISVYDQRLMKAMYRV